MSEEEITALKVSIHAPVKERQKLIDWTVELNFGFNSRSREGAT